MAALRRMHRALAFMLAAFILLHLAHHLTILVGAEAHLAVLKTIRPVYRNPVIETLLIAGFAVQIFAGLRLAWRRGWPRRFWPRLQTVSGVLVAVFLIQHIGAVFYTRWAVDGIDTNTFWAASVVNVVPLSLYFIPYYTIGIAALGLHIAARLRRGKALVSGVSVLLGALIVAGFAGLFAPIDLPEAYRAYAFSYLE